MNSQGTCSKPLFVYSYDPPSPDVVSEYDPPYPMDIATTPQSIMDEFSFSSLQSNTNMYDTKLYIDKNEKENSDIGTSPTLEYGTQMKYSNNQPELDFEEQNIAMKLDIDNNKDSNETEKEPICESCDTESLESIKSTNNVLVNKIDSQSCINTFIAKACEDYNLGKICNANEKERIKSLSSTSFTESSSSKITSYKDGDSSSTCAPYEYSDTNYSTDLTMDEARCLSPQSTTQSVSSLPSDTITINVPFDSASSSNENNLNEYETDVSINGNSSNGTKELVQKDTKSVTINTPLSTSLDCEYDSALESPGSRLSPPFTESCTITPFPTDFPTPYSTNPTSSPLPSPINLDFPSAQQSESSPSTPSTVTSSTMFCVTRKLESLATNDSTSDLASNKENDLGVNQNNQSENEFLNNNKNETQSNQQNESNSCFKSFLVSDSSSKSIQIENQLQQLSSKSPCEVLYTEEVKDLNCKMKANIFKYRPNTENSNVSKLKTNFMNPKMPTYNTQVLNSKPKPSEQNLKQTSEENFVCEENKQYKLSFMQYDETFIHMRSPPLPPPRKDFSNKSLPPPIPPPPIEEMEEDECKPPVPSLPINLTIDIPPTPPHPPVRQYLLIPITPGKGTPVLLTPPTTPTTPHRSYSYRKSPPPPPPPRQCTPVREIEKNFSYSQNSLESYSDSCFSQPGNSRLLSLTRELTPVPEEGSSPIGQSPSQSPSPANKIECKESSSVINKSEENYQTNFKSKIDGKNTQSSCRSFLKSPSPPPPLPPKPTTLKLISFLNPPPPPPLSSFQRTGSSSPRTPDSNSFDSKLPGTPESNKSTSRLSPCRGIERSPPNDRIFAVSPTDTKEHESIESHKSKTTSKTTSEIPPPAPSIPPPTAKTSCMSISPYGKMVINRSDLPLPTPDEEIQKVFVNAKNWGWLDEGRDTIAIYTQFRPIIQQGPQCGLVALSMASQVCPLSRSIDYLLEEAKRRGISRHGEMFSAKDMSELSDEALKGVRSVVRKDLLSSPVEVCRTLLEGDLILFPYDAEPNHFPGLNKGRKAHWGLLCGCLIQHKDLRIIPETTVFRPDQKTDFLWHFRPIKLQSNNRASSVPPSVVSLDTEVRSSRSVSPYLRTSAESQLLMTQKKDKLMSDLSSIEFWNETESNILVLYRQGKSRNLIYVPLSELCKSNKQLVEYPASEEYIIHSVEEGLSNQVVILHKEMAGLSDLVGTLQEEVKK